MIKDAAYVRGSADLLDERDLYFCWVYQDQKMEKPHNAFAGILEYGHLFFLASCEDTSNLGGWLACNVYLLIC